MVRVLWGNPSCGVALVSWRWIGMWDKAWDFLLRNREFTFVFQATTRHWAQLLQLSYGAGAFESIKDGNGS